MGLMMILLSQNSSKPRLNVPRLQSSPAVIVSPNDHMISPLNPIRGAWPPILTSMIIGPSVPSSSSRGGNEISGSGRETIVRFLSGYPLPRLVAHRPWRSLEFSLSKPNFLGDLCKECELGQSSLRTLNELGVGNLVHESIERSFSFHSGAPLTCLLSTLNLCMKPSVDSPSLCLMW
ncbi:hypothetical protein Tco_0856596 [Tanacetum coccineum]|uniref:Uncharacterized protein n=1 Tax=Tanacetum coccineum TaxID=301880 RepID=A0ABQ5B824_9ASTR